MSGSKSFQQGAVTTPRFPEYLVYLCFIAFNFLPDSLEHGFLCSMVPNSWLCQQFKLPWPRVTSRSLLIILILCIRARCERRLRDLHPLSKNFELRVRSETHSPWNLVQCVAQRKKRLGYPWATLGLPLGYLSHHICSRKKSPGQTELATGLL